MFVASLGKPVDLLAGRCRRRIVEEPEYNRVSTYSSSNDAYVVEEYGFGCSDEGITAAEPAPAP